jgi:drug/metabolite transporter (DMT)-like permease
MTHPSSAAGLLMTLGAAAAYGFNITFTRLAAMEGVPGPSLVLYRVAVMLVIAVVGGLAMREALGVPRERRGGVILLGLASAGVGLCYLSSVAFIPVAIAAVIFYTFPVLIVLASPFVDGRRLSPAMLAVALVAFIGVIMVVGPAWGELDPIGLLLAAGASASATVQFFAATRLPDVDTWPKLLWVHVMVLPVALLAALATGGVAPPSALAAAPWSVFLNIAGFVIGFTLQMMALARISAVAAGLTFCAEPVIAALTAALVLGERLGPVQYAGGALVLAAIAANILRDRRAAPAAAATEVVP